MDGIVETRGCPLRSSCRVVTTDAKSEDEKRLPSAVTTVEADAVWSAEAAPDRGAPPPRPASAPDACAMPKKGAPGVISTEFFAAPAAAPQPRVYLSFFFGRICVVCPHFFFLQLTARGCRRA